MAVRKGIRVAVQCAVCETTWEVFPSRAKQNRSITCSAACLSEKRRRIQIERHQSAERRITECAHCGASFQRKPAQIAKYASSYCRRQCKADAQAGIPKPHLVNGEWLPCEWCGAQVWRTPGTRQPHTYCSRKCANSDRETRGKVKPNNRGPKHPYWNGGRSQAPYAWGFNASVKQFVRQRDGHRCRHCGVKPSFSGGLAVHHIDKGKTNHHPDNLILLCRPCHIAVHPPPQHGTAKKAPASAPVTL